MRNVTPYLKMQVLAAIDYAAGKTRIDRIKAVADMQFRDENGHYRQFTWRTIQTWYSRFKKHGITSMNPKPRADSGTTRKLTPEELLEAVNQVLPFFHGRHYNRMDVYRKIIEKGIIASSQLAQTTFYRFVTQYGLLKDPEAAPDRRRLAFAMQYANQLWQGDTMFGPYVKDTSGKPAQSKLIAFIDDASRVITHGQFFFNENSDALIAALRQAFYKRGIPDQIYVDNGGIYTSQEITLICARLGVILRHAPLRDGASKGKIERFFRRVRDQFISRRLDLSSLESLNKQFTEWVEQSYNAVQHSALGMKPVDRFALDLKRIRFLPPHEASDELFYAEETRMVKKDNTFPFKNVRYETPADLRDKQIVIRFDRNKPDKIIIYYKDTRIGPARKLDLIANGLIRRRFHKEALP